MGLPLAWTWTFKPLFPSHLKAKQGILVDSIFWVSWKHPEYFLCPLPDGSWGWAFFSTPVCHLLSGFHAGRMTPAGQSCFCAKQGSVQEMGHGAVCSALGLGLPSPTCPWFIPQPPTAGHVQGLVLGKGSRPIADSAGDSSVEPCPGSAGWPTCHSNFYPKMPVLLAGSGGLPAVEWL